ncbi:unnamed protein product, partial [Rotaria sp. Silwood2]
MITSDVTSEEVRKIFKGKKVLIIGDSICRGIYKDLCCLLSGKDGLLSIDELRFNRRINNKTLFDHEIIDFCTIDRTNNINNVEKRRFSSAEYDYHLDYWFCSRVWNRSISNSLSYIEQYNYILMQSIIWDLSRYNDRYGKFYLENLDVCLSNMKKINKNITWIIIPPSDSSTNLNKLILQMHLPILEILKFYDCASLDLYHLKNHSNIRSTDGIHFTPTGHRVISCHLIKLMSNL